jgi:hypothetical protein
MCSSLRGAARLAGPRQASGQRPAVVAGTTDVTRDPERTCRRLRVSTHRALGRGRVRPGRERLPHHALEKLAAAPAAVARLLGKPATLLWPASSTNPTYSSNHSGADSVASVRRGSHGHRHERWPTPEQGSWPSGATRTLRMVPTPWRPRLLRVSSSAELDRSARYAIVAKTASGVRQWHASEMRKPDDSLEAQCRRLWCRLDAGLLRSNGIAITAPDAASS